MATNILGIGIANAIGFNRQWARGNILPKPIAAWSATGKTNDDKDRAILKDLTGNGHDITLSGFAFSEMSGYGGYKASFNSSMDTKRSTVEIHSNYFILTEANTNAFLEYNLNSSKQTPSYKVKVTGIKTGETLRYRAEGTTENVPLFDIKEDGIYTLPAATIIGPYQDSWSLLTSNYPHPCNIRVDILPEYPGALVLDGVNDCGICENMPIMTDYTIIAKREWFNLDLSSKQTFISKRTGSSLGAFNFEGIAYNKYETNSFGTSTIFHNIYEGSISFCSKNNYNGIVIKNGTSVDTNTIILGARIKDSVYWNGAFYSAYLFDRSLTEEEIKAFIRKNIDPNYVLPNEQQTTE